MDSAFFLSEFDTHERVATQNRPAWKPSIIWIVLIVWFFLASIPLVLGQISGANCIEMEVSDGVTSHSNNKATDSKRESVRILFGYLAELNHGVFYLLGIPFIALLAKRFIQKAEVAFVALVESRSIELVRHDTTDSGSLSNSSKQSVIDELRVVNRNVFRKLLPVAFVGVMVAVYAIELTAVDSEMFGWVQAKNILDLEEEHLDKMAKRVPEVKHRFGVNQDNSLKVKMLTPTPSSANADRVFWIFLLSALFVETLSITLLVWLAAKMIFVVFILSNAEWVSINTQDDGKRYQPLIRRITQRLGWPRGLSNTRLNFYPEDPARRCGIGVLDDVYNLALLIGAIAAIIGVLQRISNYSKGTAWFMTYESAVVGQLISSLLLLGVMAIVTLFPLLGMFGIAQAEKRRLNMQLRKKIGESDDIREKHGFLEKETVIKENTVWPLSNKKNMSIAGISFLLILFASPVGLPEHITREVQQSTAVKSVTAISKGLPSLLCGIKKNAEKNKEE